MTDASNARLSEATESSRPFSIRLTPDERNALDRAASARGLRPSTMARRAVLEASERPLPPVAIWRDKLASVVGQGVGELGRIGNLRTALLAAEDAGDSVA
jgi:predicted transcriptional regulator